MQMCLQNLKFPWCEGLPWCFLHYHPHCVLLHVSSAGPLAMKWAQPSKIFVAINSQWYWPLAEHRIQVLKRLAVFHMEMSKRNLGTVKGTRMPTPGSLLWLHTVGRVFQCSPLVITCHGECNTWFKTSVPVHVYMNAIFLVEHLWLNDNPWATPGTLLIFLSPSP